MTFTHTLGSYQKCKPLPKQLHQAIRVLDFPSTSEEGEGKGKGVAMPSDSEAEEEEDEIGRASCRERV